MLLSREFSNQLCALDEDLPAGYKRLDLVSKWLITLLMDESSTEAQLPIITKKIRDEVWDSEENIFRRSTFLMSVKAMLHHNLVTLKSDAGAGRSLYKLFMLKLLVLCCAPYQERIRFNIDLLSQAIAKLARRIEKLSDMEIAHDLLDLYKTTIDEAKQTIGKIRERIDGQIDEMHKVDMDAVRLKVLTELDFKGDIHYKMPQLQAHLNGRAVKASNSEVGFKSPTFATYKRHFLNGIPSVNCIRKNTKEIEGRIFWIDFERFILYEMEIGIERISATDLRKWWFKYAKYTETKYKDDPLSNSRMVLVRLKMLAILDAIAMEKYPLLKEHRPGVELKVIDHLLLPQSTDMRIAFEIENYFRERKNAIGPSLIEQEGVNKHSFSVKFATNNTDMRQMRDEILNEDKKNVEQIEEEWNEKRKEASELRNQITSMTCEFTLGPKNRKTHSSTCKCCEIKRQIIDIRIEIYEKLLPEDEDHQNAIVFELNIPKEIACLRDLLYDFAEFCHGEAEPIEIKELLSNSKLAEYNKSISQCVELGSTKKRKVRNISVEKCTLDTLISTSGFNCVYYGYHGTKRRTLTFPSADLIKNICTLKAQHEYAGLQWALQGTQHTENQVLATQSKCGTDLTLSEYKSFGSLRADGHRLQMRKLYAMIETEALSFEKEDVLALVMQTLWECEERGEYGFVREAHIDYRDDKFCTAMIELLENFVEQQKNNWTHPFKILTATLIAVRIIEIIETDALAEKMLKILCRIRSIALEWLERIDVCIQELKNPDGCIERGLRLKLIYVAIIGSLTFFIHPKNQYFDKMFPIKTEIKMESEVENEMESEVECKMENQTAVESWLRFIICLNNNVRLYTNDELKLPSNVRMFFRLIESVGISLQDKVHEVIKRDSTFISEIIRRQWRHAGAKFKIKFVNKSPHILEARRYSRRVVDVVSIDIITGSFLVKYIY